MLDVQCRCIGKKILTFSSLSNIPVNMYVKVNLYGGS